MNFAALRYEELALNAFPVLHTEVYDGWILRFPAGRPMRGTVSVRFIFLQKHMRIK